MMRKGCRVFSAVFAVLMLLSVSCFSAFSAENHYYIKELNMNLDLPDNMVAITRESPETDRYFSLFGLDYTTTMNNFKSNNIYLQGMYEDSSKVFTVTMLSDENSKNVGNYSDLSDEQLLEVENSFLAEKEYTSCTVQRYNNYVFMQLQFKTQSDGQAVNATQCNTVIDGNNITLTLQPAKGGELTNEDYQTIDSILQSVEFDGHGMFEPQNLIANPAVWIVAIMAIFIIVLFVLLIINNKIKERRKAIKRQEKKIKNQQILMELAKEYSSQPVISENNHMKNIPKTVGKSETPIYESEETAEDIITQFRNSKDFEAINRKRTISQNEEASDTSNEDLTKNISIMSEDNIVSPLSEEDGTKTNNNIPFNAENKPVLKIVTPDIETETKMSEEYAEEIYQEPNNYFEDEFVQEYDEDSEYNEDNSIIGSEESFDQSEDYFDEALDNDIYSRETVDDEDNYENNYENNYEKNRINRVDKDAVRKKAKTAGAVVLNGILIFLNGAKTFFIHLGYFCTNLFRLIKRNIKRRKQRKAEMLRRRQQEEARRRREENLKRKQRNVSKDANGLVKVHSRNEYSVKRQQK